MTQRKTRRTWAGFVAKTKQLGFDWGLIIIVSLLCIIGLAFLASSLSTSGQEVYLREFLKQLFLGVGIGGFLAFILARTDYHLLLEKSKYLVLINFILLAFLGAFAVYGEIKSFNSPPDQKSLAKTRAIRAINFLPIKPHIANGAVSWIDFPFLPNFQVSELTKLALLLYFGFFFWKYEFDDFSLLNYKKPLYAFVFSASLIMLQPDLGTLLIICLAITSAMWTAKIPMKILGIICISVLILTAALTIITPYRMSRITAFLNPSSEDAAQIRGVQTAIQNGGMFGKGYGNSEFKQMRTVLFEQNTDAIIAIIGEEAGYVGTIAFLSLYVLFVWRALKIGNEAVDMGGKSLATGIAVWIAGQAFVNVGGMVGIMPLTGVPLPFVSKGGSSMVLNLIAVGILINISSQKLASEETLGVRFKKRNLIDKPEKP